MTDPTANQKRDASLPPLTRRCFLQGVGGAALALGAGAPSVAMAQSSAEPRSGQPFRFAYLPDIHLMHDRRAPQGMARALDAVMALDPKPAFLVTGGDLIDNLRDKNPDEAIELADLFLKIWADHTDLPAHHLLGNHDAAGWRNDDFPPDHPLFAYNLLKTKLNMPALSQSFDHGGWHFVTMHDITLREPDSYISEYDGELLRFIRDDLAAHGNKPTMMFCHFPPVSAIEFFDGRATHEDGQWTLSSQRMSRNPMDLVAATGDADVKAIFSGHIHRRDRINAMGRTFICAGSVSGDKWRGHDHETPEGFGVIDCHADGTFDYRYHDYGWDA